MKRILAGILAMLLLMGLAACGGNSETPDSTQPQQETQPQESVDATEETTGAGEEEPWGKDGKIALYKNMVSCTVNFRWPIARGVTAGTGEAANQSDGTLVLVDCYSGGFSPEVTELTELYPAYKDQTEAAFRGLYDVYYQDGSISVGEGEMITVGEYDVCRYTGVHTYHMNDRDNEHQFVVYAIKAKMNDSIVYWLVEDMTEDQSAGAKIEEYARKIVESIVEE